MPGLRKCSIALIAGLLVLLAGCGGKNVVRTTGKVTLDGEPVSKADVQFYPDASGGEYAHGRSDSDGTFRMRTDKTEGVEPGQYRVTVIKFDVIHTKTKGKQSILPSIYASKDTTPLRVTVPCQGSLVLELSSAAKKGSR